ncbi:hypothetical protein C1H76_2133 [Elsinoe australis]|uniref:Uncharacterized protein n=1 Tax=Elsinoe australis TaxID=40998 RepID=A0A4U7B2M7_9PEZI|nr:hypothetical protein C1H76_2133 [Elsinoe australis]
MSSDVLRDRDLNVQLGQATTDAASKPAEQPSTSERDAPRTSYDDRLKENKEAKGQPYVSPSDAIMSPASKKLSSFKQNQINKSMPKRSLFAKATSSREKDLGPE